jgi:diguanylate cyclase (GGDEF)-like protein
MSVANLPTVLVVDDDRANRTVLAELLRGDCRLILAKDGPSALRRMRSEDVSLVLLDVSMPGMDGYEVLRQIKANPRTSGIGVIFITGQTDEADEERGLQLGAADYVWKPIRPAVVRARVRVHLKLAMQRQELIRLSTQDDLTGIANRRHFDEVFEQVCRSAGRSKGTLSVAMLDVDHFKQYNDLYGHGAGDAALRQVAAALSRCARRPHDMAARYGGEEFVLLAREATEFEPMLEGLRRDIMALGIPHEQSSVAKVITISGGGLTVDLTRPIEPILLLRHADRLLYRAKHEGRNRILLETISTSTPRRIGTNAGGI